MSKKQITKITHSDGSVEYQETTIERRHPILAIFFGIPLGLSLMIVSPWSALIVGVFVALVILGWYMQRKEQRGT